MAQEETKKRGRGRPRKEEPTMKTNLRLELDLYEWLKDHRGETSINQFVNDIIRERAGL